jgi:hypothetical protein
VAEGQDEAAQRGDRQFNVHPSHSFSSQPAAGLLEEVAHHVSLSGRDCGPHCVCD